MAMRERYDALVIGSGFGGAVTACRLAEHGRTVAVLERGRRWNDDDFPRTIGEVAGSFWDEKRSHGFLEYLTFPKVDVVQGTGVGGGSLHYFNVNLRAPKALLERPGWPDAISLESLAPYYSLAENMLGSAELVPPVGESDLPPRTREFMRAAEAAGYRTEQVPIAVHTGAERLDPLTAVVQRPCTYCGNCLFGCDIGAKNTLDRNYLAVAELHGAEIHPLHVVETIAPLPGGGYEVEFRRLDADPGAPSTRGSVEAASVIVAAGSLGSTELLLRCRDEARTLPGLSTVLGSRFSINGEFLFASAMETARRTDPGVGPPITAMATIEENGHHVSIQDLGLPDSLLWFLEGAAPPTHGRLRRLAKLAVGYIARLLPIGNARNKVSLEVDAVVAGGRTPNAIPYLGMGTDTADGTLELRNRRVDLRWDPGRNREMYKIMHRGMTRISKAAGGRFMNSPLWRWPLRKVLTAHPLGGCPMGTDPSTSVVDDKGEVWGHPGLYVVDGSIIPSALGVNPSLTIAALAERAAHLMTHDDDLPGSSEHVHHDHS